MHEPVGDILIQTTAEVDLGNYSNLRDPSDDTLGKLYSDEPPCVSASAYVLSCSPDMVSGNKLGWVRGVSKRLRLR